MEQSLMAVVDTVEYTHCHRCLFSDGIDGAVYVVELEHLVQFNCGVERQTCTDRELVAVTVFMCGAIGIGARGGQVVVEGAVNH